MNLGEIKMQFSNAQTLQSVGYGEDSMYKKVYLLKFSCHHPTMTCHDKDVMYSITYECVERRTTE